MFRIDVLTAFFHCGVSALAGAGVLSLVRVKEPAIRSALRCSRGSMVLLGLGLLPFGVPRFAEHWFAQWTATAGSLAAVLMFARALGLLSGRPPDVRTVLAGSLLAAGGLGVLWTIDPMLFAQAFAVGLAGSTGLMAWATWPLLRAPRSRAEWGVGAVCLVLALSSVGRMISTLAYRGPQRLDLTYLPEPLASVYAVLYGVVPIVLATLLLSVVNQRLQSQLRVLADTDELTGATSRRAVRELAPEWHAGATEDGGAAALLLDLDHFKLVNDRHGHAAGDQVLRHAVATWRQQLRPGAVLARLGGEEFLVLAATAGATDAAALAERLRSSMESVNWADVATLSQPMTVSIGWTTWPADEPLDTVLQRADEALYIAKQAGRNRCATTSPPVTKDRAGGQGHR